MDFVSITVLKRNFKVAYSELGVILPTKAICINSAYQKHQSVFSSFATSLSFIKFKNNNIIQLYKIELIYSPTKKNKKKKKI